MQLTTNQILRAIGCGLLCGAAVIAGAEYYRHKTTTVSTETTAVERLASSAELRDARDAVKRSEQRLAQIQKKRQELMQLEGESSGELLRTVRRGIDVYGEERFLIIEQIEREKAHVKKLEAEK